MKKFLVSLSICVSLVSSMCQSSKQITHQKQSNRLQEKRRHLSHLRNILTTLIEEPYSYHIKPEVTVIYEGTVYTFTPDNAMKPIRRSMEKTLPIHYAAEVGDVGDIKTLISWGADSMSKNRFDETPLIKAVQGGNFRALYYLLANGAEITKSHRPFQDFNAFHYAVLLPKHNEASSPTVIRVLQALMRFNRSGAHLNETSRPGTPLEIALKEKLDPHIIRFLITQGANITDDAKKALNNKRYKSIKQAIQAGTLHSQVY